MENKLAEIKNISMSQLKNECSLDQWHNNILNKTISELNLLDVSRMLRQDVYPDIAVPLALDILKENPFEGEMYEGQLLELLIRYYENHPKDNDQNLYLEFIDNLHYKINEHEWDILDDKVLYKKDVEKLNALFCGDK